MAMTLKYPAMASGRRKSTTGRTLWCGPFAVAMVTGLEYDDAYKKVLADIRRSIMANWKKRYGEQRASGMRDRLPKAVMGTQEHQIARILNKLKIKCELVYYGQMKYRPTLITFVREHTVKGHTYIIVAGHHWVTIKDGILYHSHHDPIPVEDAPKYRKARIECWADVKPRPEAIIG